MQVILSTLPPEILWLIIGGLRFSIGANVCKAFRECYRKYYTIRKRLNNAQLLAAVASGYRVDDRLFIKCCTLGLTGYVRENWHNRSHSVLIRGLRKARSRNHRDTADILLAIPGFTNPIRRDRSALIHACKMKHLEIAQSLFIKTCLHDIKWNMQENLAFIYACGSGDMDLVNLLLPRLWINPKLMVQKIKAMELAAENGHLSIFQLLIDSGVNPGARNNIALLIASIAGHLKIVLYLLTLRKRVKKYRKLIIPGDWNNRAIKAACENGHVEIVRLLIVFTADQLNYQSDNIIAYVIRGKKVEILWLLIDAGLKSVYLDGDALRLACQLNAVEIAQLLLDSGITQAEYIIPAMTMAATHGHIKIVQLLLSRFPDVIWHESALVNAAWLGHLEILRLLIKSGVDPGAQDGLAFVRACRETRMDIVEFLLSLGPEYKINITGHHNDAFVGACITGNITLAKLLLDRGADLGDQRGTALCEATRENQVDMVKFLLTLPFDISHKSDALIVASEDKNRINIMQLLLDSGANPRSTNNLALELAVRNRNLPAIRLLLKFGANARVTGGALDILRGQPKIDVSLVRFIEKLEQTNRD